MKNNLRLGVNIDHVATIRNARGGNHPDPIYAATLAAKAGADSITAHLREDRRHVSENDIAKLSSEILIPLNLEIAATEEMLNIASTHVPYAACIVPEKREERTTEGGLDVVRGYSYLKSFVNKLLSKNIRVSVFIEPEKEQIDAAKSLNAPVIELHTGAYCNAIESNQSQELNKLIRSAKYAVEIGLECHAGHGLGFDTVFPIASIQEICELNIGHFLIGESIFSGLEQTVQQMRALMDSARDKPNKETRA
jgi:pyridoxine 5-phosphate synthase